jgi:hypothetical protein
VLDVGGDVRGVGEVEKQHARGEHRGEDHADRRAGLDPPEPPHRLDQRYGEKRRAGGAGKIQQRPGGAGEQEGDDDAGQHDMADRLAEQRLEHRALGRGVDAGEGLVGQAKLGLLGERPGEGDALRLAARELADLAVGEIPHADAAEAVHRPGAVAGADRAQRAQFAGHPHRHDVEGAGREIPVDRATLQHAGDAVAGLRKPAAEDGDGSREPRHGAERGLEQRGPARAVRPDDRGQQARGDVEVDRQHRRPAAGGDGQPAHRKGASREVLGQRPAALRGKGERFHHSPADRRPSMPRGGAVPPSAAATVVTLRSIMPR